MGVKQAAKKHAQSDTLGAVETTAGAMLSGAQKVRRGIVSSFRKRNAAPPPHMMKERNEACMYTMRRIICASDAEDVRRFAPSSGLVWPQTIPVFNNLMLPMRLRKQFTSEARSRTHLIGWSRNYDQWCGIIAEIRCCDRPQVVSHGHHKGEVVSVLCQPRRHL